MTTTHDKNIQHWIIRVGDGINLKNSKFMVWGIKRGKNDSYLGMVKKFKKGDVLWFLTSKKFGGKIIYMAEYECFYDKKEEPLVPINTFSNKELGWIGDEDWDIQVHYNNLYLTEKPKLNLEVCIRCSSTILNYDTFKNEKIKHDLNQHYKNLKIYADPIEKRF